MRPPVLPSGNDGGCGGSCQLRGSFNEAAGFTQRKHVFVADVSYPSISFNEAAGFYPAETAVE